MDNFESDSQKSGNSSIDEFPDIVRRELAKENDRYQTQLAIKREESLSKLQAWRTYYEDLHPDLAHEYDQLVADYCHEDGWFPDYYGEELRELFWAYPYKEQRFINEDLLPDGQKANILARRNSPIAKRFAELQAHRNKLKAEFEEFGE